MTELLRLGTAPLGHSGAVGGTPLAWAVHGSTYHRFPGLDYVAVAELLAVGRSGRLDAGLVFTRLADRWLEEDRADAEQRRALLDGHAPVLRRAHRQLLESVLTRQLA